MTTKPEPHVCTELGSEPHVCTELMQTDYYEFACAECGEDVVLDE